MSSSEYKAKVMDTYRQKGEQAVRALIIANPGQYLPALVELAIDHMKLMAQLAGSAAVGPAAISPAVVNAKPQRGIVHLGGSSERSTESRYFQQQQQQQHEGRSSSSNRGGQNASPYAIIDKCPKQGCGLPGRLKISNHNDLKYVVVAHVDENGLAEQTHSVTREVKAAGYTVEQVELMIARKNAPKVEVVKPDGRSPIAVVDENDPLRRMMAEEEDSEDGAGAKLAATATAAAAAAPTAVTDTQKSKAELV